ncbi:hypothetical protein RVIR1_11710 [Candidatus Rickettsiella viridis]|uniref:Uncharacterized protein n=1 Tax=Candidatus Rickettsiella viridis TaxID=676208 RepID=A0A2Z5UX75_9COXI|nr:hypothetical protein RVIR1_11710 [Candidatus Rickettsiella viridis]
MILGLKMGPPTCDLACSQTSSVSAAISKNPKMTTFRVSPACAIIRG